ncbi:MAG: hypothetical protein V1826_00335 [bacterium]
MKGFYLLVGLLLVVGVAYASYNYGANWQLTPRNTADQNTILPYANQLNNNAVTNNTATNSTIDTSESTYTGDNFVTVTSPKNGAIISIASEESTFDIKGAISPNANKILVSAYMYGYYGPEGLDGSASYKLINEYTLQQFKPGDTKWTYHVSPKYENLYMGAHGSKYIAQAYFNDGSIEKASVELSFNFEGLAEMGKPVIYLYPTQTQAVKVNVQPVSGISASEPGIGMNGWEVTASPDGSLLTSDGEVWPYLFWEGFAANFATPKEGFVLAANEVGRFFDDKLSVLGLNAKEIADFKEFWVPRMQAKPYYFITFVAQSDFDRYAPLTVSPQPQTVIRVFFDYRGLDRPIQAAPQTLRPAPARDGFTVIEWGGRIR